MSKWSAALVAGVLLWCASVSPAVAQAPLQPYQEYDKRIKATQQVAPLTSVLFGESISLYNGSTTFTHVDIDVPGNNVLPVRLARKYRVESRIDVEPLGGFYNWDLDIPHIYGTYIDGWMNTGLQSGRCSNYSTPLGSGPFEATDFWSGAKLYVPEEGDLDFLRIANLDGLFPKMVVPNDGHTYKLGTKAFHRIRCKTQTANGYPGEAFIVVDRNGVRTTFDWVITRAAGLMHKKVSDFGMDTLGRQTIYFMPTRMEDRFGNWVTFTWSGDKLQSITASDGRQILLTWSGNAIATATVHGRTWQYGYVTGTLATVQQPDGSRWQLDVPSGLRPNYPNTDYSTTDARCLEPFEGYGPATLRMTHPSGAVGVFEFALTRHRRTGIPSSACTIYHREVGTGQEHYAMAAPDYFDVYSIYRKTISGPGLATRSWRYSYEIIPNGRVDMSPNEPLPCNRCTSEKSVYVDNPDGTKTEYRFGTLWHGNDGRLLARYDRDSSGTIVRSIKHTYMADADAANQPFPDYYGYQLHGDDPKNFQIRPVTAVVTRQDGTVSGPGSQESGSADTYRREVTQFDGFGRPLREVKSSSLGYSRTEVTEYHDDTVKWVLGQVKRRYEATSGVVLAQTDYNASALPWKIYGQGTLVTPPQVKQTLTYHADGTLASITDGRNNVTQLSDWKRGIPQLIRHPATPEAPSGATESAGVNDHGWIDWVVEEGTKTCYGYDAMGRLARITYPSETQTGVCDSTRWNETILSFVPVAATEYGIPAGHWRHTVSTGNARKVTYFDAFWRPLVEESFDNADPPGTRSLVVKRYDLSDRLAFQSYPLRTLSDFASVTQGTRTTYDALGRVVRVEQDSELGVLATTTQYRAGLQTFVRNPRNHTTTTGYLAWDEPNYDLPISIGQPEGKEINIGRDVLGKPHWLRQRNTDGTVSLTRRYVYDPYQRVCKLIEPETGATVTEYDAADNVVWAAAGLSLTDAAQCNRAEAANSGRRVFRQYDARNRLTALTFPDGAGNQTWSYWPDGKVNRITTTNEGSQATNTYQYFKRGLLLTENLTQDAHSWSLQYDYDRNGHLASHRYPSGRTVAYAPNALGQPTQAGTYATGVMYHPNGGMARFTYGNGVVHTLIQNTRGLPDRSMDAKGTAVVLDDGYDYDANGNVMAISDGARSGRDNGDMVYDGLDRLTQVTSPMFGTATYGYDVLDNLRTVRIGGRDHTYYYDASWRLTNVINNSTGATVIGLGYDAQGNLTNKNGQVYRFDYGNRLREAQGLEKYRYDGHGRRVEASTTDKGSVFSFYGQDGVLRYQRDQRQARAVDHIYLNGSLVARVTDTIEPFTPTLSTSGYSTNGSYTISWNAITGASRYELQEASNGGAWQALYSGSALSHAVSGKGTGTYSYRVRACNTVGCGAWSATAGVTVQLPPSGAPTVSAPDTGPNGAYTVTWTTVSGASSYRLEESFNGGSWVTAHDGSGTSKAFSGRAAGSYRYRTVACNPAACSAYSNTVTVNVVYPPGTPTITVPSSNHGGSYPISWTAMSGVTSYRLDERFNGGAWTEIHNAASTSLSVSGRVTGTYGYRVRACNIAECSAYSTEGTVQVLLPPGSPTLSVSPGTSTNGSYTVSWTAVATATSYRLEESVNGGGWTGAYSGAGTSIGRSGRGNGTYTYRVRACNAAGCSGYSNSASSTVTLPPPSSSITYHHKHLVYFGGSVVQGSCAAEWSASAGATSYNVRVYQGGMAYSGSATFASGDLSSMLCAPQLQVQACNAAGCSAWSPPSQQTVSEEHHDGGTPL